MILFFSIHSVLVIYDSFIIDSFLYHLVNSSCVDPTFLRIPLLLFWYIDYCGLFLLFLIIESRDILFLIISLLNFHLNVLLY